MLDKKMQAKYVLGLDNIKDILAEQNIQAHLVESNDALPVSMLIMPIDADEKDRPRAISASYIPMGDDDLENTDLLQLFSQYPFPLNQKYVQDLSQFLLALNLLQPIGNFGIKDDFIYLRYVLVVKKYDTLDPEEILETFMMFEYALQTYQELIEEVNSGAKSLNQATHELNDYQ